LDEEIDLFNDSDHSADYERPNMRLSESAALLGDNSHVTSKLAEFSMRKGQSFVFLSEEPADHWYRVASVGISFPS
jgi:hypothetical protein